VKVLDIQSSPRGESSDSITLTNSFIEACKSDNGSIVVDTLNVWLERLPEFDSETIGAKYINQMSKSVSAFQLLVLLF
jgi:FMN-dependent NADH-azoreductase